MSAINRKANTQFKITMPTGFSYGSLSKNSMLINNINQRYIWLLRKKSWSGYSYKFTFYLT